MAKKMKYEKIKQPLYEIGRDIQWTVSMHDRLSCKHMSLHIVKLKKLPKKTVMLHPYTNYYLDQADAINYSSK